MKITLQLQVLTTEEQKATLLSTMEAFNAAASHASEVAFRDKVYSQPAIHKRCYANIREKFRLSAQMAVRAIGKAVETFARDRSRQHKFKPLGAICYDERIASFKGIDKVSLWTLKGRMILPMIFGEYQAGRLNRRKGQMDLVYRKGKFFLLATAELPEDAPIDPKDFLGVDMGVVNIATDSDGNNYSCEAVEKIRVRNNRNRKKLQRKGTRSSKRRLKKIGNREANFRRNENHRISKEIVQRAKDTDRGIAIEDLKGIRDRTTVRRKDRNQRLSWSYHQLRSFIEYKARLAGVFLATVDPRNTSRACNACGHCDKGNRKTQDSFVCQQCGHSVNADLNASRNIRDRGKCQLPPDAGVRPCKLRPSGRGS
jgi:putative transposase